MSKEEKVIKIMAPKLATKISLAEMAKLAYADNRRLISPLVGFPGCDLLNISLKVAQQNHRVHYNCIEELVNQLNPDMAFMMMDLSVEANALGLPVRFPLHESSSVEHHPVESIDDLESYRRINILQDARIQSYIKTIEMMSLGLGQNTLTGAYIIGPVTLAGLLQSAQRVAMDSVLDPHRLETLCEFSTSVIQEYANALVNAGADIICILEPTGVILGPDQFRQFSTKYVRQIIESYKYSKVDSIYHVCGNTMHLLEPMAEAGVNALSLDSPETGIDMVKAAQTVGEDIALIGNINPTAVIKDGSADLVRQATTDLLEKMRPYPNFILSTGCDLPPGTPLENMKTLMQTGRNFK